MAHLLVFFLTGAMGWELERAKKQDSSLKIQISTVALNLGF
jgi:hypothetical protein